MPKTAWRAVVEALEAEGVEVIFGLPGNPQHLLEDLKAHSKIRFVLMRDEPSAVDCAYAYARLTGKPGVCFSNPGPGITNLVTGLLEATSGSLPVIALCNGVSERENGMGAFQELDAVAMMRPVTKWAVRLTDTPKTPWTMRRAFDIARNGRPGAVFVEIASDKALSPVEMPGYVPSSGLHRSRPEAAMVERAAAALAEAKRPVMLCGGGAVNAGAFAAVRTLAEKLAMPVFTTPGGRGILGEDHPMALGLTGLYLSTLGKKELMAADLVLTVGSRLEAFSTLSWQFLPEGATHLQIDCEPEAIGLNWPAKVAMVGDARLALEDLATAVGRQGADAARAAARAAEIAEAKKVFLAEVREDAAEPGSPLRPRHVVSRVNEAFGRDTVLVKENGGSDLWCYYWPYYRVLDEGDCVPMAEQTAMGLGVIGCIGAKLAKPEKNVVCITGDGAMMMAMKEIATAVELRCGVTWVVLNNQSFGWVQYTQVLKGQEPFGTDFQQATNLKEVAEAQGCAAARVERAEELGPALEAALEANRQGRPFLIDVAIARHDYCDHFVQIHRQKLGH